MSSDPALAEKLALPGYGAKVERCFLLHLEAFNWNPPAARLAAFHGKRNRRGADTGSRAYRANSKNGEQDVAGEKEWMAESASG